MSEPVAGSAVEPVAPPAPVSLGVVGPARGEAKGSGHLPPLLGVLGFTLGLLIILWDYDATDDSKWFTDTPQFLMWAALIAGQIALWFALVVPLWRSLREFTAERVVFVKAALYAAGALALIFSPVGQAELTPLAHHVWKMRINNLLGAAVVALALIGIWLAQAALEKLAREIEGAGGGAHDLKVVKRFLEIRGQMEHFLLAAGVFVGAATLATGGLRNALLAFDSTAYFPFEIVLVYGLLASGILALVYAPAHARLVSVRKRLRDVLVPLPDAKPGSWGDWNSERKAVEDLLGENSGVMASFAGSVSILTPLIGSLLAILLGANQ
jgi:hypothetical protein